MVKLNTDNFIFLDFEDQTAWTWVRKPRTAMLRPGRDKLSGYVKVGETLLAMIT